MTIPGKYVKSMLGHRTFLPDPLPPTISLPPRLLKQVEEATLLLGRVDMCRILLPNADLLIYSSLQREALASSTIEGTVASPNELVRYQVSQRSNQGAVREVSNYRDALAWGYEQQATRPLAGSLFTGLHERLLLNVRGAATAGRFKTAQNFIGSGTLDTIDRAVFVPAAPEHVPGLIRDLETYINEERDEPRVVQCALTHYQFETIHPFNDGNGRVGRLIIILHMMQLGLLSAPLIYPSVYFERRRSDYYGGLQRVRDDGDWENWIEFFTEGIRAQCQETIELTQNIIELREHMSEEIRNVKRRASVTAVLDAFFREPVLTISQLSSIASIAWHSAQSAVEELEARRIVIEITGKDKGRVYACAPVFQAIFGDSALPVVAK